MTVDRAQIFQEVTQRNALRRSVGLPPLDVKAAYAQEVQRRSLIEYRDFCEQHRDLRRFIRDQVVEDFVVEHGRQPSSAGGAWLIEAKTQNLFERELFVRFGRKKPDPIENQVIPYGEDRGPT